MALRCGSSVVQRSSKLADDKTTTDDAPYVVRHAHPRERGLGILNGPRLNKGMAFTLAERQALGIHGLLPPAFYTQEQQARRVMANIHSQPNDLAKYIQLNALQKLQADYKLRQFEDRNEKLFYRVLMENVEELMPIVYTPTVGLACQKFGFIYRKPKGLYITIHDFDVDKIFEILSNWPERDAKAVVITDGERILGLGDLGANGMGIPVGKLALYVALAGIQPKYCLPILLDVGTNTQELLDDPFYIGLKHKRVTGDRYDQFVDNVLKAIIKRYGQDTLIQFEDFANHNAFRFLEKYRSQYLTFNDDIQGTASVAVAGLIAAARITNRKLSENKFLFYGAGEASIGIAQLTCMAMEDEGMSKADAVDRIWMIDSKGLITKDRTNLSEQKKLFAKNYKALKGLGDIVKDLKPSALLGAATIGGAFSEEIIRDMAKFNDRPIIFALSNPTSKSECTAEQAYTFSDGRAVFASGSPFDKVVYGGKTFYPGQGNNSYIFPGVALGAISVDIRHITDEIFLIASETLAKLVSQKHLDEGRVYPPLTDIREISVKIATAVAEYGYKHKVASYYPQPKDLEAFLRGQQYQYHYRDYTPMHYDWPVEYMKPSVAK